MPFRRPPVRTEDIFDRAARRNTGSEENFPGAPETSLMDRVASGDAGKDYSSSYGEVGGVLIFMRQRSYAMRVLRDAERVKEELRMWDPATFRDIWRYARTLISLQGRLYLEQIFFEMGTPWSDLVTGFKPVEKAPDGP